LVSEALLRSQGKLAFPALRQFGYAYFDNLVYGHAPGQIFGQAGAWLWLRKGLVSLDNPQINYLTAHSHDKFFAILMNESSQQESVTVAFHPENITKGSESFSAAHVVSGEGGELALKNNAGNITIAPRGLLVLQVDGLDIDVPSHHIQPEPGSGKFPGFVKTAIGKDMEMRAAAIQMEPGPWEAYIWCTAKAGNLHEISLNWSVGNQTGTLKDVDYPYEFSVPVPAGHTKFRFSLSAIKADGTTFSTTETNLRVSESNVIQPAQ